MNAEPSDPVQDATDVEDPESSHSDQNVNRRPLLTDVHCERNLAWSGVDVFVSCGLVAAMLVVMFLVVGVASRVEGLIAGFALLGGAYWLYYAARTRHAKRRARELVRTLGRTNLPAAVSEMFDAVHGISGPAGVRELVTSLAQGGEAGSVLRICRMEDARPISPFEFPFEPQPLNQAHSALLDVGCESATDTRPAGWRTAPDHRRSSPSRQLVRRNVLLKGGWVLFGLFAFNLVINALMSLWKGSVSPGLVGWTVLVLLYLFLPAEWHRWNREWLVVPGGVVVRRSGVFASRWKLCLFERRTSVLLVVRRWRSQWSAVVSNGQECMHVLATQAECEFLLRGWLSPLPPPSVERLSDLQ